MEVPDLWRARRFKPLPADRRSESQLQVNGERFDGAIVACW
ncbi:MAG TPA: hypothetical protein VIC82_10670 [Candidatus Nanopelagicales bacterium]